MRQKFIFNLSRDLLFSFFCFACLAAKSQIPITNIAYNLSMEQPQTHYFSIEMFLDNLLKINGLTTKNYIDFKMPVWTPGSYLIREYAKNVEDFSASDGKKSLKFDKINKNTWRVQTEGANKVTVSYKVYAYEMSVRTSFLDDTHGYLNGASIFMFVPELKSYPSLLKISPYKNWSSISTAWKKVGENTYFAQDYDTVVDSPIEIGTHKILTFQTMGVPHSVAMYSNTELKYDEKQVTEDFQKITETAAGIVGEQPCEDYTFILHHLPGIGGGLEHLNSTTCGVSPNAYTTEGSYKSLLGLIAHEYFHLWNVKRIRPIALGPFDYETENYSHMLWVCEGITSFYSESILRRAGYITSEQYMDRVAASINGIENQPGEKVQSVAEASWDAWIKYYRPNENSRNSTISYYEKGAVLGSLINLFIVGETKGQKNLDDVYRFLWNEYYKKQNRGYKDEEFQQACEKIAGKSMESFFENYVWGTKDIDYNAIFQFVGLKIEDRNASSNVPYLGATIIGGKIAAIVKGSGAYEDGLNVNDEVVEVDGLPTSNAVGIVATKSVGDKVKIKVKRFGQYFIYDISLKRNPTVLYKLVKLEKTTTEQEELLKKWLYIK